MNIENSISNKIRKAAEDAILKAIHDLNSEGYDYQPIDDFLYEWAEPDADESIKITCAIGVSVSAKHQAKPKDHLVQSFISLAESGNDVEATLLNQLEGDIANGGFMQLYDNKGEKFIKESIALLQKIASKSALRIVKQALSLFQEEQDILDKYEIIQKKVGLLNNRFWNLKESIPALFIHYRQKDNS